MRRRIKTSPADVTRSLGGGFTLIELMIVVGIIAILAAIAAPKFADMLTKAQEGTTKGNLGALRSALNVYYADNLGVYPACTTGPSSTVFSTVLIPNYISAIPPVTNGLHPTTYNVYCDAQMLPGNIHDAQGWYFDGAPPADQLNGNIWVACGHVDTKGTLWTTY